MGTESEKLTPMMKQYWELKSQHKDKILLYRMGDFYEMFFEDAEKAAPVLNIALTSRNKNAGNETPMCGVPHHSIGPQINKLLNAGFKVAICDQIEDPKDAKGIVKRAVTRVVTPGIVYDPEATLDSKQSRYVAAILSKTAVQYDFSAIDVSTGQVLEANNLSHSDLLLWIEKLNPSEFVVQESCNLQLHGVKTVRDLDMTQSLTEQLISYVQETQGADVLMTLRPVQVLESKYLRLSPATLRHLEIFKTSDGEREKSLSWIIDETKTPMGSRLLKQRLATPFADLKPILIEQSHVDRFLNDTSLRSHLRDQLSKLGDLERKIAKLSNPLCNARDLQALAIALGSLLEAAQLLGEALPHGIVAEKISSLIMKTLREELPVSTKEGGLIQVGFNAQLDELVDLATNAQTKLSELENREREASGISSLKIKYNSVFGYSFEITKANADKTPAHFVRRQTLANAERFVTAELSDLEQKILSSQQRRCDLEYQFFKELKFKALECAQKFLEMATWVSELDVRLSFAHLAFERNFVKPTFSDKDIELKDSRHAVIERLGTESFIPNNISLKSGHCLLLTGPNMAGKSTLMRQVALSALLAQCGSFVPASLARLPLFDSLFTRIGASDNLGLGLSTFMVEMTETAEIISCATERSLVILDEIGRGTSTYDGMSLAQAVLEHFVDSVKCYTLFATHYHELTDLSSTRPQIDNGHMAIQEHKGELIFLRQLLPGPASRSYGIEVAKQAGLPKSVTERAHDVLKNLTKRASSVHDRQMSLLEIPNAQNNLTDDFKKLQEEMNLMKHKLDNLLKLENKISSLKINALTPLDALNKLSQIQSELPQSLQ